MPENLDPDADGANFSRDVLLVAQSLLLDRKAATAADHLRAVGVQTILLKGAAIATWLYDDGELRPYSDIDLLVSPAQLHRAKQALAELGYQHLLEHADPCEFGTKEQELFGPGNVCIDLHHGLIGAEAPGQHCWDVLVRHTVPLRLADGTDVQVLDLPARAMHLALHAAQNGPIDRKALADLERGLARVDRRDWLQAADLAEELGAAEAFAAGLRLLPAGEVLAEELSLTRRMTVELSLRTQSAPQHAIFFERLVNTPTTRARAALLARKLFPTAAFLRANSEAASRSRAALAWARISHPVGVVRGFGPAIVWWVRARRATRRPDEAGLTEDASGASGGPLHPPEGAGRRLRAPGGRPRPEA